MRNIRRLAGKYGHFLTHAHWTPPAQESTDCSTDGWHYRQTIQDAVLRDGGGAYCFGDDVI